MEEHAFARISGPGFLQEGRKNAVSMHHKGNWVMRQLKAMRQYKRQDIHFTSTSCKEKSEHEKIKAKGMMRDGICRQNICKQR